MKLINNTILSVAMVMLVMVMMTAVVLVTMTVMLVRAPISLLGMLAVAIVGVRLCEALRDGRAVVPCDNLEDTVRMVLVHKC